MNITLKDPFQSCVVILHKNVNVVGRYSEHIQKWEMHDLKSCFLEVGLDLKLPSCPGGGLGDTSGYNFENQSRTRASYFTAMELLGKISEDGCDIDINRWQDSHFCLPFKISPELRDYGPDVGEKILQKPMIQNSRYSLFLEFESPTTYVIR